MAESRPAVFLDRDGTIIEHVHHLHRAADLRLIDGTGQALVVLRAMGFVAVIVTNQSVVGRGILTTQGLEEIHGRLRGMLQEVGADVDAVYHCPHVPGERQPGLADRSDRKPGAGMLRRAAGDLNLDLSRSWMVGDTLTDMIAGRRAGCMGTVLVRTGLGSTVDSGHPAIDHAVADIWAAGRMIYSETRRSWKQQAHAGVACDRSRIGGAR